MNIYFESQAKLGVVIVVGSCCSYCNDEGKLPGGYLKYSLLFKPSNNNKNNKNRLQQKLFLYLTSYLLPLNKKGAKNAYYKSNTKWKNR